MRQIRLRIHRVPELQLLPSLQIRLRIHRVPETQLYQTYADI